MQACATCFDAILQSCPEAIIIDAGLSPNTEYYWVIKSKTGKIYQRKVSTNSAGRLTIDASVLPNGLLNSYAGTFTLEIREGADYLSVVPIAIGEDEYECILISFSDIDGNAGDNNVIYGGVLVDSIDMSHLKVTVNATGAVDITLLIQKINDDNASRVDWGDGNVEDFAAGDQISALHSYNAAGVYEMKIYPVQGVVNPAAQAVNEIRDVTITFAGSIGVGQAFLTIGNSLSRAGFLQLFHANGFGICTFPSLPQAASDQVRQVSLSHNQLNGYYLSQILIDLDTIGWPVGYADLRYNPGSSQLTANGEVAKASLIAKGWTFYI
jgi:hypothetical protein